MSLLVFDSTIVLMICVWNARGAAGCAFGNAVKELKRRFNPIILVLVETRCSGVVAQKAIKRMGFQRRLMVEAQGMSGGIWLLWNHPELRVSQLMANKQFLHCQLSGIGARPWLFTAVYASPRASERKVLWDELSALSATINDPWMLAGDFNDIKMAEEQCGGDVIDERRCKRFRDNIEACRLIDLKTEGPRFTWKGPVVGYASRLYKKLDRVLCNGAWQTCYGETVIRVGPRIQSDHHPLLIDVLPKRTEGWERPFRFEAAWLQHTGFKALVGAKWDGTIEAWLALGELEKELRMWNIHTFDHIKKKKKELIRRIFGAQRALQELRYPYLERLEDKLQGELRQILEQEEMLWFQKARTQWLNDGDRNTSYYHLKTKVRRSRNRVNMLKDENGC